MIKYRQDIDALRGLSVLLVIFYHAFPKFLSGGFVGVDVFFVISGYLITKIIIKQLDHNKFSFLTFYRKRVLRIFPAFLFVMTAVLIIGYLILFNEEYENLAYHIYKSSFFMQNFQLMKEVGYFDISSHYKPLLHIWSLSIEEQFYFVWPFVVAFFYRKKINLVLVVLVITILSFLININFTINLIDLSFYHSLGRFWEISIGAFVAIYQNKYLSNIKYSNRNMSLLGLCCILFSAFFYNDTMIYPSFYALLPVFGASIIILFESKTKILKYMSWVGLISYPLYLWHWVLISFSFIYLGRTPSFLFLFFCILLAFLLSIMTQKYIERLRYINNNKNLYFLILWLFTVGFTAKWIKNNKGLPKRSHLQYVDKNIQEVVRTSEKDSICEQYVKKNQKEKREFYYCRGSGLSSKKYIALIGDSHAHVMFPGISKISSQKGYGTLLFANSSCPTLPGFLWGRNDQERDKCARSIESILSLISQDQRFEQIIVSTRGPAYVNGNIEGRPTLDKVKAILEYQYPVNKENMTYEKFSMGFKNLLARLSSFHHVKKINYLLENPELYFLPKELVLRPFDIFNFTTKQYKIDKQLHLLRMSKYLNIVETVVSRYPKTKIIDLSKHLCQKKSCFFQYENNFLYVDKHHLSAFASHFLSKRIANDLF